MPRQKLRVPRNERGTHLKNVHTNKATAKVLRSALATLIEHIEATNYRPSWEATSLAKSVLIPPRRDFLPPGVADPGDGSGPPTAGS